jgi:ATP-dependent protease ClpP protease subunit
MATINITKVITEDTFESVISEIQSIEDDVLNVAIFSGGGNAFAGLAIYDALMAFKSKEGKTVNTKLLGLGASAASIIFMAGDNREMGEASALMIHNSRNQVKGTKKEIQEQFASFDIIDNRMLNVYQKTTGLRAEDIQEMQDAETWMTVDVALQYNFANVTGDTISIVASIYDSIQQQTKEPVKMATEEETKEAGFLAHMMAFFKKDEPKAEAKAEDEEEVVEEEEKELKAMDEGEEKEPKSMEEDDKEEAKAEGEEEKPEEEAKAEEHEDDKEEMKAKIASLETELAEAKASAAQAADVSKEETEKASLIFNAVAEHKFTMFEAKELAHKSMEDVKAACESTIPNASGAGKTERPEESSIENKYDAWMSLKSEGKHAEAQAYYNENRTEILKDK